MEKEMEVIIQPGFRFYPTEEELVSFYLHKKLDHDHQQTSSSNKSAEFDRVIPVINIYDFEPWMLPRFSGELCKGDTEQWFFFVPRQEREARGGRPNRTTVSGYWKATGSPSYVFSYNDNRVIGVKKSMVFYTGKAPSGKKTIWKMNEYRAIEEQQILLPTNTSPQSIPKLRHELSICRVYITSGSFRAFDRRPLGTAATKAEVMAATMTTSRDDDHDNDHDDIIMGARPNAVKEMVARRRLSVESSSSAAAKIETINSFHNARNDWEMPDDSEFTRSLWDY